MECASSREVDGLRRAGVEVEEERKTTKSWEDEEPEEKGGVGSR